MKTHYRSKTAKYLRFAIDAVRRHGWRDTMADVASEALFDWRHGTKTMMPGELDGLVPECASKKDGVQYQGASPRIVRPLLAKLPASARGATFVDYGCGKGRGLLLAMEAGFSRVIGIEFAPQLAALCRKNLCGSRSGKYQAKASVLVMDAGAFIPEPGPLVAFLYNPFHGQTLRTVAGRLRDHSQINPLWIVYVNPIGLGAFIDAGFAVTNSLNRCRDTLGVILEASGRL